MRRFINHFFHLLCVLSFLILGSLSLTILYYILKNGLPYINLQTFTEVSKPIGETGGGLKQAIVGSIMVIGLASTIAIPLGIMLGLFMSEYSKSRLSKTVSFGIGLIQGLPSIIIGLFANLTIVYWMHGFSCLAGAFALSFVILPVVAKTTEEMCKLVPTIERESALALGLNRTQMIYEIVLKQSFKGITTGIVLALSRASGETAPLLFTSFGSMYFTMNPMSPMSTLPLQIYTFISSPFQEWKNLAWAGAVILIFISTMANLISKWHLLKWKGRKQ